MTTAIALFAAASWVGCADYELNEGGDYGDDDVAADDDDMWDDDDASDDDTGDDDDVSDDDDAADDDDDTGADDDDDTEEEDVCDDIPEEPTTLYLSADDSNSMAAPALARQIIQDEDEIHDSSRPYEFLNYYDFYFPPAELGHLRIVPQVHADEDGEYTMLIGVASPPAELLTRRPRSLTFSVDSSGSMSGHPMDMTKAALYAIAGNLDEGDMVSILSWDANATVVLDQETIDEPNDPQLLDAIASLDTGGSTNLSQGLQVAYDLAQQMYGADRVNRVLLFSDGGANTGQTDEELIALHAEDAEQEGIYLSAIGMDDNAVNYNDQLMDTITDVGKGAYVYLDTAAEADVIFGDDDRFLSVMEIAARDVQVEMIMPEGYVMAEFHGEEYSEDPEEVEPQHLAPNDAMLFHQILQDCTEEDHDGSEVFQFTVTWQTAETYEPMVDTISMTMDEMIAAAGVQLYKADAVVAYSQALTHVWSLPTNEREDYLAEIITMVDDAYFTTGDADLQEISSLLTTYKNAHF